MDASLQVGRQNCVDTICRTAADVAVDAEGGWQLLLELGEVVDDRHVGHVECVEVLTGSSALSEPSERWYNQLPE